MHDVPDRLKEARELAGYANAADAARAMNIAVSTYQAHENGSRGVTRQAVERYARFFRVNLTWLMTGRGDAKGHTDIQKLYDELPPPKQTEARLFMEFLRDRGDVE